MSMIHGPKQHLSLKPFLIKVIFFYEQGILMYRDEKQPLKGNLEDLSILVID